MKYIKLKFVLILPLLIVGKLAIAKQLQKSVINCEQKHSGVAELSMCFDRVKDAKDRELQTWINNQTFILEEFSLKTGRRSALEMFKRSQRNFITFRENNCRWQYLQISPDKFAATAYKKCYILMTNQRIKELSLLEN